MLQPSRRGAFAIEPVHLRARSRLGFWQRLLDYPAATTVNVYPDMQQLSQYALLARTNRLSLLGVRRTRRIGQDHDFERLRDYTIDDNYKHIDWRATARRRKLTVKDFQVSQSQRIIFLIDCGRMMTNQAAGLSLLDHALNAMLMLSYVALRQGDSVGMISFSDEIHSFVPPRGGMNQMNRLLHASFDRFPQLTESRYDQAFRYLASHCRKRSLVVLVTNVIDEVNTDQIDRYLTNLVGPAPAAGRAAARSAAVRRRRNRRGRRSVLAHRRRGRHSRLAASGARRLAAERRAGARCLSRRHDRPADQPLPGDQGAAFAVTRASRGATQRIAGRYVCLSDANERHVRRPTGLRNEHQSVARMSLRTGTNVVAADKSPHVLHDVGTTILYFFSPALSLIFSTSSFLMNFGRFVQIEW